MLTMRKVAEPQSEDEGWPPPTAVTAAQFDADPRDGAHLELQTMRRPREDTRGRRSGR